MNLKTCVAPSGQFIYGIHKPHFCADNLREKEYIAALGSFDDSQPLENHANFPAGTVKETGAEWIFEIPNAFPFRGTTYITKSRADSLASNPTSINLPQKPDVSLTNVVKKWFDDGLLPSKKMNEIFQTLPEPLLLALATTSTDTEDLTRMAELCCDFIYDPVSNRPTGLVYKKDNQGRAVASIKRLDLFKALANNISLPDDYKNIMVLRPGVQGNSEIVGEWLNKNKNSHIFEYLRRNSYIPWGHYAANMANDAVRYQIRDLTLADISGMRHLYYQRTYVRMAHQFGLTHPYQKKRLTVQELEKLRQRIYDALCSDQKRPALQFTCTLWGWNFGFDFAPSRYRLHASHQQIHQQYALIPATVSTECKEAQNKNAPAKIPSFTCNDLIASFIKDYRKQTGKNFFEKYLKAIQTNRRMDDHADGPSSLIVYQDEHVIVFVPKAQTSQWELQIMTLKPIGNILETDISARNALDRAMLIAMKILAAMGARMISTIEYSKRFNSPDTDHRLLYAFLTKIPESPGAFSQAQLRWINGHYPEDFATVCRTQLPEVLREIEP
jgi:hypothetical protein